MRLLRTIADLFASLLDRLREPGWPRRIALLAVLALVLAIPYPLTIAGDFEVFSTKPLKVRNKVAGTLTEVLVGMHDRVEQGQVVARLMDVELQLEKQKLQAELNEAEARLRLLQRGYREEEIAAARLRVAELRATASLHRANLQREKTLFDAEAIPIAQFESAENEHTRAVKQLEQAEQELRRLTAGFREEEVEQALARVDHLEGRLAEVDQHLTWTEVRAPMDGRVITADDELQAMLGDYLERGTAIMAIVEPETLAARVYVPEREFGDIRGDQEVTLRAFQYPSRAFRGSISSIYPFVEEMDEFSATVPVVVDVPGDDWERVRVHTRGKAKVSVGSRPIAYIIYRRLLRSTFVRLWSWY